MPAIRILTLGSSDLIFTSSVIAKLFGQENPLLQRSPITRHTIEHKFEVVAGWVWDTSCAIWIF